jgi:gentisate 1,2-dioxygenase
VVWLDGLDIPTVRFFDAGFAEPGKDRSQIATRPEGDALARYGNNMLPVDFHQASWEPTKVFVYPYVKTRESLLGISKSAADPHFGHKLRFVNPATGASPMPTIGAFAQRLDAGFETRPYRCTDGTVYTCLEGSGVAEIGGQTYDFIENDVFVVPSWHTLRLRARDDTILFSYSDRPMQQVLGLWREEKLN